MNEKAANDLGSFLWAVILVVASGLLAWWILQTVTRVALPDTAPKASVVWMSPDDFLGDEKTRQAAERIVSQVSAPTPAATAPEAPSSTVPAPATASGPSIKITQVSSTPDVAPPPELIAFNRQIEHTLQDIWTTPSLEVVPKGFDKMVIKLTLTRDGSIIKSEEVETSGHTAMDRSVRYAIALFINAGRAVPDAHRGAEYEVLAEFRLR